MEKEQIKNERHPLYKSFLDLYKISFPIYEQRTDIQQKLAFDSPFYHLQAFVEKNRLLGFIAYWDFNTYIYIEHFAVDAAWRGKGYGTEILQQFCRESEKTIILEIDPVVDEVSAARLRFYSHCSFVANPYSHIHPFYRVGYEGHSLLVLSSGGEITPEEYKRFHQDLITLVMA